MNTTASRRRPRQPPIGFLLRKLDGLITERFERTLGTRGISRRQWQLLHALAKSPATLDELNAAVAPFLDHTAGECAEQHLDPLAEKGLLTASRNTYELTDSGRRLFDSLIDDVQATRDLTVRGLSDGDYDRTISSLETMVDNLEEQE